MKRFLTVLFILVCTANIAFCQKPAFKKPGKCNDVELQKLYGKVKTMTQHFWTNTKKMNGEWVPVGEAEKQVTAFSKAGFIEYIVSDVAGKIMFTYDDEHRHRTALSKIIDKEEISRTLYLGAGTDTLIEMITIPGKQTKTVTICEPTNNTRITTTISLDEFIKMTVDECTNKGDITKCKYTIVDDQMSIWNSTITVLKRDAAGNPTEIVTERENGRHIYEEVNYTYY